jgi:RNA polymerase sigma-70 factor (ECF subfamily)
MSYRRGSLYDRILSGDEDALGQVRSWVARFLTAPRFWRLRAEWRDLQQEVLCSVIESLRRERFHPEKEFRNYVWGICRHAALDRLARQARRAETQSYKDPDEIPSDTSTELDTISAQLVRRALDDSSQICREMIKAYYLEGMTYAELAGHFGLPVGTAKSRLFRCLECLRQVMAPGRSARTRPEKAVE